MGVFIWPDVADAFQISQRLERCLTDQITTCYIGLVPDSTVNEVALNHWLSPAMSEQGKAADNVHGPGIEDKGSHVRRRQGKLRPSAQSHHMNTVALIPRELEAHQGSSRSTQQNNNQNWV
jgi:hypothetical protein